MPSARLLEVGLPNAAELRQSLASRRLINDYRRQLEKESERLYRADRPGGVHPGWGEKGMDETVTPGIDGRFSGLDEGGAVRYNRRRWRWSTGSWDWRVAAWSCSTRRSDREGAPASIAASDARMVWAAIRGSTSMVGDSVVRYKTLSGVGRPGGTIKVAIVVAKGSVTEATSVRAEA